MAEAPLGNSRTVNKRRESGNIRPKGNCKPYGHGCEVSGSFSVSSVPPFQKQSWIRGLLLLGRLEKDAIQPSLLYQISPIQSQESASLFFSPSLLWLTSVWTTAPRKKMLSSISASKMWHPFSELGFPSLTPKAAPSAYISRTLVPTREGAKGAEGGMAVLWVLQFM